MTISDAAGQETARFNQGAFLIVSKDELKAKGLGRGKHGKHGRHGSQGAVVGAPPAAATPTT